LASVAVICTILYWVMGHEKGRKALLAASFAVFITFFIGGFTRERARKPYLIWGTMRMDQQFTRAFQEKINPTEKIDQSGSGAAVQAAPADGSQVFKDSQCQACHVYKGQGGSNGPDISNLSEKYDKKTLMDFILQPPEPANMVMPPFNGSDAELEALADYLLQN